MKKLFLNLENCYGIKKLNEVLDFSEHRAISIYAPNGVMKSSFARVFNDLRKGEKPKDLIYTNRVSTCEVTDETNREIGKENIFVIKPYDEFFKHSEKTSTLLVNNTLKQEYDKLLSETEKSKEKFLKELKVLSGLNKNLEKEISLAFMKEDDKFYQALIRVKDEVLSLAGEPFSDISYIQIFDEDVQKFLNTEDIKKAIGDYVNQYNQLLDNSIYFKRGFNFYNAETIAKALTKNGFFKSKHSVTLNAGGGKIITTEADLKKLIEEEQKRILENPDLVNKFTKLGEKINKNDGLRSFNNYLSENVKILPELQNSNKFKEDIWKSYFKTKEVLFMDLISKYQSAEVRQREIEKKALEEITLWEEVIGIFNRRFHVPFKLEAINKIGIILEKEPMLKLKFTYIDAGESAQIDEKLLLDVLSQGERKALYILNIIFEIETRKKEGTETIFIIDDIADSFDYKNKYAIIEYLKELLDTPNFFQVVLTHNFDFFRTDLPPKN